MKKIEFHLMLVVTMSWLIGSWALTSHTAIINWNLDGYSIEVNTEPQNLEGVAPEIPFIAASLQAQADGETDWFGIVYDATEGDDFWVYELYDAGAGQLIKQITLNEMLGITKGRGCDLMSDEQPDEKTAITQYEIVTGDYDLILNRILKRIEDPNLPTHQRLVMMFDVENRTSKEISLRFSEQHRNDNHAVVDDSGALLTVNQSQQGQKFPLLVQSYRGGAEMVKITTKESAQKKPFPASTAVWGAKKVEWKLAQPRVEVGVISIAASTIADAELALAQARNLAAYLQTGHAKPFLVVQIQVDKEEAYPGDLLEYTLRCVNIGAGPAIDGAVVNPLPNGTAYVWGSVAGKGTVITYSSDGGKVYQTDVTGEVTHIKWNIDQPILPGQSVQLSFRTRVFAE